ncbi:hypothetical protein GCM10027289_08470 [Tsukamurella serpentis]
MRKFVGLVATVAIAFVVAGAPASGQVYDDPADYPDPHGSFSGLVFASPSGNLSCFMNPAGAVCHATYAERPAGSIGDCPAPLEWSWSISVDPRPSQVYCAAARRPDDGGARNLPYGHRLRVQPPYATETVECASMTTGMRCVVGKHGFVASREGGSLF